MSPTDDANKAEWRSGHEHRTTDRTQDRAAEDKDAERPARAGLSRRAFLGSSAATALANGLLPQVVRSAPTARDDVVLVGPGPVEIELLINGRSYRVGVEPRVTLLDTLRERLDITGAKKVCDRATCGACTVLEDGRPIYACTRLAIESVGRRITTVEGLGTTDHLSPVQAAFVAHDAQQCGFCTPGFVVATTALLARDPRPTMAEAERALGGNLCRCGTYGGMKRALRQLLETDLEATPIEATPRVHVKAPANEGGDRRARGG